LVHRNLFSRIQQEEMTGERPKYGKRSEHKTS
jgi:hypothetical protein